MTLPNRIVFDSSTLLRMHTKRNRPLLEFAMMKFSIFVPQISVYEYLLAKAFLGKSPEYEMGLLKEIYSIVPLEDEIIVKAALITNKLLKNRQKMPSSEILVGVTAILKDGLLITEHPEAYNPLRKYGLDVISTEKFIEELNELIVKFSEETSRANVKEPARG